MLHPTAQRTPLLAADWQIRPLLPSDSLEQLTDLIHRAYVPHLTQGLRKFGCLNCSSSPDADDRRPPNPVARSAHPAAASALGRSA